MKLSKGEFSLFNFSSQKTLIFEKGISIVQLKINEIKEIRVYLLYDFFVEVVFNSELKNIENIDLNISGIPEIFFE